MDKAIYKKLLNIQQALKAPKNQYNEFGKYNYRSCEDILEGLKPLLNENSCVLLLNDTVVQQGDRYYIAAEATLIDTATGESVKTTAYAREAESRKGMEESQVTGSTSSYARKYALNGLFCIDDVNDADATQGKQDNKKPEQVKPQQTKPAQTNSICSGCGAAINQAVEAYSAKHFGSPLCKKCQKGAKASA